MVPSPQSFALNSATYTAITADVTIDGKVNNKFNPVAIYTEDKSAWYMATDSTGTDAVLIPADLVYHNDSVRVNPDTGIIMYAKAAAGTPKLVVLLGLEPGNTKG